MNIAFIVPSLKQAGPVNVAFDLATLFTNNGHDVEVFYFDELSTDIHSFPCRTTQLTKDSEIPFNQFDIIHTHGQRPTAFACKIKNKYPEVKFISTAHNYVFQDYIAKYGWIKGTLGGLLYLKYLKAHDCVIALSEDAKKYYSKWIDKNKLTSIYNSRIIDSTIALPNATKQIISEFKGDGILIGTNASLIKRKGLDILIKAFATLPESFKLIIAGNGPEQSQLLNLCNKLNVSQRVKFLGFIPNAHLIIPYYDIFCLPSRSEGFPLGLLEAAYYGKPTVVSDLPTLLEAFSTKEVLFFESGNSTELASRIMQANSEKSMLGQNLFHAYQTRFSPHKFYTDHIKLYNSLLK